MKSKSTFFCAKEAASLLWEVMKLLVLIITPGVDRDWLPRYLQSNMAGPGNNPVQVYRT
jgi:hypothetical protein